MNDTKQWFCIENVGEIVNEALYIMGAGTKRGDATTIGQFQTGNKYALAVLLNNGYKVKVFSGEREIKITTEEIEFRHEGNNFDLILVDGVKTGLTTATGKDWKVWMGIREFKANAIDEGGASNYVTDTIEPEAFKTKFYIEYRDEVIEFQKDIKKYFSEGKSILFDCEYGQILEKHNDKSNIYRKGIRCYDSQYNSAYDYNIYSLDINEDRLAKNSNSVTQAIMNIICKCDDKFIIDNIVKSFNLYKTNNVSTFESNNTHNLYNTARFTLEGAWEEFVTDKKILPYKYELIASHFGTGVYLIVDELYDIIINTFPKCKMGSLLGGDYDKYIKLTPTDSQINACIDAQSFIKALGYNNNYEWNIVDFVEEDSVSRAEGDTILLDISVFDTSQENITKLFFKEYLHISTGISRYNNRFVYDILDNWYIQSSKVLAKI